MYLQKGSGINSGLLESLRFSFLTPYKYLSTETSTPNVNEGFGVTEGNGGFETVRELENPRNNLQITGHGAAGIFNETETTSLSLP